MLMMGSPHFPPMKRPSTMDAFPPEERAKDLVDLELIVDPRPYVPVSFFSTKHRELCIFSDASTMAISAVAYLRGTDKNGHTYTEFLMGKEKLASYPPHIVPRLKLCAAVLAVELTELIKEELYVDIHKVTFYTDSQIVLGYINNTSRRFHIYMSPTKSHASESLQARNNGTLSAQNTTLHTMGLTQCQLPC